MSATSKEQASEVSCGQIDLISISDVDTQYEDFRRRQIDSVIKAMTFPPSWFLRQRKCIEPDFAIKGGESSIKSKVVRMR